MKSKKITMALAIFLLLTSLITLTTSSQHTAEALSASDFKAGRIIDDEIFYNSNSMSVSQIQQFLNAKMPACDTNGEKMFNSTQTRAEWAKANSKPLPPYTCLKEFKQDVPTVTNGGSDLCKESISGGTKSAAQILYNVSKACDINPQVLIVMLQKEQSLVTDDWPWPIQYKTAMGYGCPDTGPNYSANCDSEYYGFFNQVYQAAKAFRRYEANPDGYNYRTGRNNYIQYNPNPDCGGSDVFIHNQATTNLYIYTPYQPNAATLDAAPGETVHCGAYGNINFWRMFNNWFGASTTSKSILFKIEGSGTYYLEWSNFYYPIASTDILYAYGLANISPRTIEAFPDDKTKGPSLTRSVKFGSDDPNHPDYTAQVVVVDGGKRHGVPNWKTLSSHGFSTYQNYDPSLAYVLGSGDALRSVVRAPNGAVFLLENNKKRGFPDWGTYSTLSGPNVNGTEQVYSEQSLTRMTNTYLSKKSDGAPMLLNGKFITSSNSPGIYLYDNGKKLGFSASTYAAWGGKTDYIFSNSAINQIPDGERAPVLVQSNTGMSYLVDRGVKRKFDDSSLAAWGFSSDKYITLSNRALARLNTINNVPLLATDSGPGVYSISGGKKHGIPSLRDFGRLDYKWEDVEQISKHSLNLLSRGADLYAPGSLLRTPNGAVYLLNENYQAHGVTSSTLFYRYGFSWKNVYNVTAIGLRGYVKSDLQTLIKDSVNGKYYVVESAVYRHLEDTLTGPTVYNMRNTPHTSVHPKVLETLKQGKSLTRFLRGSSPTVYYIEDGKRRPFSTEESFYNKGGSWDKVIDVSDIFLEEIPRGALL